MASRRLRTANYAQSDRDRLAKAVSTAREAAGHRFRPSFAREAGVAVRGLQAVELGEPVVGQAVLHDIAKALGRHFDGWTTDTPRRILEGEAPPPLTRINKADETMLAALHQLRHTLDQTEASPEEVQEKVKDAAELFRRRVDHDVFRATWDEFVRQVTEGDLPGATG